MNHESIHYFAKLLQANAPITVKKFGKRVSDEAQTMAWDWLVVMDEKSTLELLGKIAPILKEEGLIVGIKALPKGGSEIYLKDAREPS